MENNLGSKDIGSHWNAAAMNIGTSFLEKTKIRQLRLGDQTLYGFVNRSLHTAGSGEQEHSSHLHTPLEFCLLFDYFCLFVFLWERRHVLEMQPKQALNLWCSSFSLSSLRVDTESTTPGWYLFFIYVLKKIKSQLCFRWWNCFLSRYFITLGLYKNTWILIRIKPHTNMDLFKEICLSVSNA